MSAHQSREASEGGSTRARYPVAVAGCNHELVLHARVAGYEPAWCDVLYDRQ